MMTDEQKAADVVRAHELINGIDPGSRNELCSILRRRIAELAPEQADKAIAELFYEIEVCDDVFMESRGFRRIPLWRPK